MSPRVIGLYGGSGAGKSQAAAWLGAHGALVIDADQVSREVSAPGGAAYGELREAFPESFLPDGTLDRRALGRRVFADEAERRRLENIVQPHMRRRMEQIIAQADAPLIVLDCAVLLNPFFRDLADKRWLVTAPEAVRKERIGSRDHLSAEQAQARLAAQESDAVLAQHADLVIVNDGTPAELAERLRDAYANVR